MTGHAYRRPPAKSIHGRAFTTPRAARRGTPRGGTCRAASRTAACPRPGSRRRRRARRGRGAEREVEGRGEERGGVDGGVEGVRLLELERRHGGLLVRTERQLE